MKSNRDICIITQQHFTNYMNAFWLAA